MTRRRGLTFIELLLGMSITAMIGGAVAAVTLAVSEGWKQGEASRGLALASSVPMNAIVGRLRSAKYIGYVIPGAIDGSNTVGASAIFWKQDAWGSAATADGRIQLGELSLIEHDKAAKLIYLYESIPYSQMTAAQQLAAGDGPTSRTNYAGLVTNSSAGSELKTFLTTQGIRSRRILARNVAAMQINPIAADANGAIRPGLEILYRLERGAAEDATASSRAARQHVEYGFVALRAPTDRPS